MIITNIMVWLNNFISEGWGVCGGFIKVLLSNFIDFVYRMNVQILGKNSKK